MYKIWLHKVRALVRVWVWRLVCWVGVIISGWYLRSLAPKRPYTRPATLHIFLAHSRYRSIRRSTHCYPLAEGKARPNRSFAFLALYSYISHWLALLLDKRTGYKGSRRHHRLHSPPYYVGPHCQVGIPNFVRDYGWQWSDPQTEEESRCTWRYLPTIYVNTLYQLEFGRI